MSRTRHHGFQGKRRTFGEAAIERLIGEHREMRQKLGLESKPEQHATDLDPADFF